MEYIADKHRFLTAFTIPYLLDEPYANLKAKVGFVFGSTAICAIIFGYLCIPECKGRSLEEVDKLFLERVPIRDFKRHQVIVEGCDAKEINIEMKDKIITTSE